MSQTDKKPNEPGRVDAFLRSKPVLFTCLLVLMTALVATALLFQRGYSFVLYQGF